MTTYAQVKEIKNKFRDSILEKKNVVGVGIGRKIVDGQVTDELCVKIYVERKTALSRLTAEETIPRAFEAVKTDVVEVGRIVFQGRRDRNRPTQGGDSIGSCHSTQYGYIMAGTLGAAIIDKTDGKRVLLSNNHVLANVDNDTETRAHAGDSVVQPGTLDGGSCTTDVIGTLKRWIPFSMSGDNEVDAAIADLTNSSDAIECQIGCDIGRINGSRILNEGDLNSQVQKCGRTTGYTTGTVLDVDATVNVGYELLTPSGPVSRTIRFVDQIMLTAMSDSGDSGSLILDMNEKAVGLLFAGSTTVTIANRIEVVLNRMNLEFCPKVELCRIGGPIHCLRYGPVMCIIGGPGVTCRRGGPSNEIHCVIGGPDSPIYCRRGGPQEEGPILCRLGGPRVVGPMCLACGPDSPVGCGMGGPDDMIEIRGCPGGPDLMIRIKDPSIDPKKILVLDKDKIPADMRLAFEKMLEKMAKER